MTAWATAVLLLALLAVLGLRLARNDLAFFAASRSVGPVLAGLAGTAAGVSAFVFVGGPGLFLALGAASLWIVLSAPLTTALQCWAVGEPVTELVRRHGCLTVPDLVAARFGEGAPRALAAAVVVLGSVAMLAVQARAASELARALLGTSGTAAAVAVMAATAAVAATGGMRLGVLVEGLQGAVMGAAGLAVAAYAVWVAGGPRIVARLAADAPELLDLWHGRPPVALLGWFLLFGLGTCAQPHYVQKFLLLRDREALRWLPAAGTAALVAVLAVWVGLGLSGAALVADGRLAVPRPDALTPAFLATVAPAPLVWVAVAAVAAAVGSTATSLLNLAAAAIVRDLPLAAGRAARGLPWARRATAAVAAAATYLGLATRRPLALLGVLGWGTFTAGLLPVLLVGLSWEGASRRGAVVALSLGPAVQLALEAAGVAGWEPGLSGAAVGTMALVGLSLRRKGG